jgi:uncharacterized phage protein (TIGR01671 family)
MNRPIKFRVWNINEKKFCTKSFRGAMPIFMLNLNFELGFIRDSFDGQSEDNYVFQQFTGLKDINNKDIYEGDIIKYNGNDDLIYKKPGIVSIGEYSTHSYQCYHYGIRIKRIDMENFYFGLSKKDKDYLIIGNIFENPDLLQT